MERVIGNVYLAVWTDGKWIMYGFLSEHGCVTGALPTPSQTRLDNDLFVGDAFVFLAAAILVGTRISSTRVDCEITDFINAQIKLVNLDKFIHNLDTPSANESRHRAICQRIRHNSTSTWQPQHGSLTWFDIMINISASFREALSHCKLCIDHCLVGTRRARAVPYT